MQVAVLVEPAHIETEERLAPMPAPGGVLIRVSSVGVGESVERIFQALDSDRTPGSVKTVVAVS